MDITISSRGSLCRHSAVPTGDRATQAVTVCLLEPTPNNKPLRSLGTRHSLSQALMSFHRASRGLGHVEALRETAGSNTSCPSCLRIVQLTFLLTQLLVIWKRSTAPRAATLPNVCHHRSFESPPGAALITQRGKSCCVQPDGRWRGPREVVIVSILPPNPQSVCQEAWGEINKD